MMPLFYHDFDYFDCQVESATQRISRVTPWSVVKNKTAHGFMDSFRAEVYVTKLVLVVMRVCQLTLDTYHSYMHE